MLARASNFEAIVFVIPEYNYGISAPLKNALEAVNIPFVATFLKDGVIYPNDVMASAARAMLDALRKVAPALKTLR
jgi:NAD(P)H-dependent FMN reductase